VPQDGFPVDPGEIDPLLKPHIKVAVQWGLAGGRRAAFLRFGMQKTTWHLEMMRLSMPTDHSPNVDTPLELTRPAELRRIGKEKRLIVAALVPKTNPDAALIKVVVRAHQWFEMLKNRTVESTSDLAGIERVQRTYPSRIIPLAFLSPDITAARRRSRIIFGALKWFGMLKDHAVSSISQLAEVEKLPRTYVGCIIPLALLAPDITTAIVEGRQPPGITLDRLIAQPLPIAWSGQRALLGWGNRRITFRPYCPILEGRLLNRG